MDAAQERERSQNSPFQQQTARFGILPWYLISPPNFDAEIDVILMLELFSKFY